MFRFFRTIRQQLLSQNRFTRYLIYALGEIILVVIGILIALQINNWNEESKSRAQVVSYLEGIRKNVQSDTSKIRIFGIRYKDQNKYALDHIGLLLQDSFSVEVMSRSITILSERYLTLNTSGYESLKTSNQFSQLKGLPVEDALFNYYEYYKEVQESEESLNNFIESMETRIYNLESDEIVNIVKLFDKISDPHNPEPLTEKQNATAATLFKNSHLLGTLLRASVETSPRYDNLLQRAEALMQALDDEIGKG